MPVLTLLAETGAMREACRPGASGNIVMTLATRIRRAAGRAAQGYRECRTARDPA
ncbi:MAG: hypothetical protein KDA62_18500 [Planctomycetales bacterium]|nr:hypothetical protein [Planctomycetales bacterium]